jgi:hypothetical protein
MIDHQLGELFAADQHDLLRNPLYKFLSVFGKLGGGNHDAFVWRGGP